jgi:hypothetical protein
MLNYQTNAGAGVLVRFNRLPPAAIRPGPRDLGRSPGRFRVVGRFRGRRPAAGALRIGRGSGLVRVRPGPVSGAIPVWPRSSSSAFSGVYRRPAPPQLGSRCPHLVSGRRFPIRALLSWSGGRRPEPGVAASFRARSVVPSPPPVPVPAPGARPRPRPRPARPCACACGLRHVLGVCVCERCPRAPMRTGAPVRVRSPARSRIPGPVAGLRFGAAFTSRSAILVGTM